MGLNLISERRWFHLRMEGALIAKCSGCKHKKFPLFMLTGLNLHIKWFFGRGRLCSLNQLLCSNSIIQLRMSLSFKKKKKNLECHSPLNMVADTNEMSVSCLFHCDILSNKLFHKMNWVQGVSVLKFFYCFWFQLGSLPLMVRGRSYKFKVCPTCSPVH